MTDLFAGFFDWMEALPAAWAYAALFGVAWLENVVPPIPGDMVVVFGGYLASAGTLSYPVVVTLATLGGALGFMSVYAVGYRFGGAALHAERLRWLPAEGVERARAWVRRWGYGVVAANRFLTGARSVISLAVGLARMDPWKTAAAATFSAAVWTALIAYAGYAVGANWRVIQDYLSAYGRSVLAVALVLVLARLGYVYWSRRRAPVDGRPR